MKSKKYFLVDIQIEGNGDGLAVAEVREDFGTGHGGHEATTGKEVIDAVAHLEVTPCAEVCRLLLCGMEQAVRVNKVAFRQEAIEVVAFPLGEVGTRLFQLALEVVILGMDDVHVAADDYRKQGRKFLDEGTELGVPLMTVFNGPIKVDIAERNIGVNECKGFAVECLKMAVTAETRRFDPLRYDGGIGTESGI